MKVDTSPDRDNAQRWFNEYSSPGMPSSFRGEPSSSVVDFAAYLKSNGLLNGTILDIGFGKGRNSLYLAGLGYDVHGMELVPALVDDLIKRSATLGLSSKIHPICRSVTSDWPYEDGSFDAASDTFCYKHQIDQDSRRSYKRELARVLKPGGYFLLTLADLDDGYYGPLLGPNFVPGQDAIITDPAIGVQSVLYSYDDIIRDFSPTFKLVEYEHKIKEGIMYANPYLRKTHVFKFAKEPLAA